MKPNKINQIWKLASILGITGLNGNAAIAAISGLFTIANIPLIAITLMAGPGAIITAALVEGNAKERMIVAILAGILATSLITFAAAFGPRLLEFVNQDIIRIKGGISVAIIALIILGLKIPSVMPLAVIIAGIVLAGVWR